MKKIMVAVLAAVLGTAGAFAFDLGDINGTWRDAKWDADWTFSADGKIVLTKASSGESVFTFTDANVKNFKLNAGASGVSVSFDCSETERSYKFTKPLTFNADLDMHIDPEWTSEDYDTSIKFQKK